MNLAQRPKVVVLGMMTKMPVAGVVWQTLHYLLGLEQLGCDVYYVEAHARTPSMLMQDERDDGSAKAAALIDRELRRYDLGDRWAFHALHDDGRVYGMSEQRLARLYRDAALIVNLHGGTVPRPEHYETGRLVFLETDPVQLQIELDAQDQEAIDYLEPHMAFFTFAENYGNPDCLLPVSDRFEFHPTRQPVALDLWAHHGQAPGPALTTIANWRQQWRTVRFRGDVYHWSKDREFRRVIDLPGTSGHGLELALSGIDESDRRLLEEHGWSVRDAGPLSADIDAYREYIQSSRGEFTVAKDQNVRFRSGWFSDRSATYLAAGRPVITQDTGLHSVLPTGEGLFTFSTPDEAVDAVGRVARNPARHGRAASAIAREFFSHEVVLGALLDRLGLERRSAGRRPLDTVTLEPVSRQPLRLPAETESTVAQLPLPRFGPPSSAPRLSVVVVTHGQLTLTQLCLRTLAATTGSDVEVIVVDNASPEPVVAYLRSLEEVGSRLQMLLNSENRGFAAAANQGLQAARGETLVLMNNDVLVRRGWLERLAAAVTSKDVGAAAPTTNRIGDECEILTDYRTVSGFRRQAAERLRTFAGQTRELQSLRFFCVALRAETYREVGPLDEGYGLGLFEDEDYCQRLRHAGYRLVCAEDVFVHHFGQGTFGELVPTGAYSELFSTNRARYEERWSVRWTPPRRRPDPVYDQAVDRIRARVAEVVPPGAGVAVISKGDERLVELEDRTAWHFPAAADGGYAGYYPKDGREALGHLEHLRAAGADFLVIPSAARWWLDHYPDFAAHLACLPVIEDGADGIVVRLGGEA